MVAVGLLKGDLVAEDYEDGVAADSRLDRLRNSMVVEEDPRFSDEYHQPEKRSIANAVQVFFRDGTSTEKVTVEYPLGHRRRRGDVAAEVGPVVTNREAGTIPQLLAEC